VSYLRNEREEVRKVERERGRERERERRRGEEKWE
jgi:hypothetical protein